MIVVIFLLVWALGGVAIVVLDFNTTRVLFYDWQTKITFLEYRLAFICGIIIIGIIWTIAYKLHVKKWYIDTETSGLYY